MNFIDAPCDFAKVFSSLEFKFPNQNLFVFVMFINFSYFQFLFENQTWHKVSLGYKDSDLHKNEE